MAYEDRCIICDEAITNPVCPACLEKQIMQWVYERNPSLSKPIKEARDSVAAFEHDNTNCVICRKSMNVCPHCYCKEIFNWLVEEGYLELATEFLERFNYELDYRFDMKSVNVLKTNRLQQAPVI